MRNLVISELMSLIDAGVEVYGKGVEPIQVRKELEVLSNRELLDILMDSLEFQG